MTAFYTESPTWHEKIGNIHAMLERVKISEEQSRDVPRLRRLNRILSIHASTAIEGNCLTLEQATDVINEKPVWGPPKDIREIKNAWGAYNEITHFNPWAVGDLLRAHAFLTDTLVAESGQFRTIGVAVVRGDGKVLHQGAAAAEVPALVERLLYWGKASDAHPLIKSSAVHFMLEHIHPFRDGNGRIGRLWQTLILSQWNPLFAWMPVETLVYRNQARYYKVLQESHAHGVDCQPFIDFMLDIVQTSLYKYVDTAVEIAADGENVPVNVPVNPLQEKILILLRANPKATTQKLALALGVTDKTIKRHQKALREQGILKRIGPDKTGHWEVGEWEAVREQD
ncbi:MAG: Fic family protein [Azoarcus sp.]|jgi:Fic family protein|nr:Fic family protein [Azoarcus sp.]